jgi:hypothetical protein
MEGWKDGVVRPEEVDGYGVLLFTGKKEGGLLQDMKIMTCGVVTPRSSWWW